MKNKDSRARMQVIFGVLLFAFVMSAELYAMINYSKMYLVIVGLAVIDLVCLYIVINGMFTIREIKDARNEEQYDSVFKSEKASYLMLKKYFEEIEDKLDYLEKAAKVPTEEIVNAQKGIAKVIINRSRENTEALINSNEQVLDEFTQCSNTISDITNLLAAYKDEIVSEQKKTEDANEQIIQVKMQDLVIQLKDMELRLSQAISQVQKVSYQQPVVTAAYMPQSQMNVHSDVRDSDVQQPEEPIEQVPSNQEPSIQVEASDAKVDIDDLSELDAELDLDAVADMSDINDFDIPDDLSVDVSDLEAVEESLADFDIPTEEAEEVAEVENPEPIEPEPAITTEPEVQPKVEEEKSVEEQPIEEKPIEEKPPMPDLSDPNKSLSPDEIAALFANMSDDSPKEEPQKAVEPEPIEPEPVEEKPPMPDLSDPNKNLSPDEIAALFANMQ